MKCGGLDFLSLFTEVKQRPISGSSAGGEYTRCRMKPGRHDRTHQVLITGAELRELKRLDMPESLGLDRRIERYQGSVRSGCTDGIWSVC